MLKANYGAAHIRVRGSYKKEKVAAATERFVKKAKQCKKK